MKIVYLKRLTLSNWRAQNRTIEFSDGQNEILGRNKSGKSTTKDAILWLLTGYDSEDRFNYQLFDTTQEYSYETSVPASVEAEIDVDGVAYTLKRVAKQGWTRKRGGDVYEKKNTDDYSFFIDSVESSSGEYTKFIENLLCPLEHLKFILNISHFMSLDWREMRKILADIIGEIKPDDYQGDYSDLTGLLEKYGSLDTVKDMLDSRRKPVLKLVGTKTNPGTLQPEIDALEDNLPGISGAESAETRSKEIRARISALDGLITGASESIKPAIRRRNEQLLEISRAENELEKARADYDSDFISRKREINLKIIDIERANKHAQENARNEQARKDAIAKRIEALREEIKKRLDRRLDLLEKNKAVKARVFSSDRCAYCGQQLPPDMLEDARQKFNDETRREHERIVAEGKANNEMIADITGQIEMLEKSLDDSPADIKLQSTVELKRQLTELIDGRLPFENTAQYMEIKDKIDRLKSQVIEIPVAPDTSAYAEEKESLLQELSECGQTLGRKAEYDRMVGSIEKKKQELTANINELVRIEGLISLADSMEKEKMEIIRRKVQNLFDICDIEMEVKKKDGTMTPACNISVNGVPWAVLNTAGQIAAGIDMSNAFCKHDGISMPLLLDNMESVDSDTEIMSHGRQMIIFRREDCDFRIVNY